MEENIKGTFMLGIDVELAWGLVHRKRIDLSQITRSSLKARKALDNLLGLFEKFQIPATWSILGHLILKHCSKGGESKMPHPDMPRPNYSWLKDDWYRYDPCTDFQTDPAWYGKDIVDKIVEYVRESNVPHEIGCHSFSHQQFGDPGCGEELARAEIEKCLELMDKEYGIVPRVFSFPRAYVGHTKLLKEYGFKAFVDTPPKLNPCVKLEKSFFNYVNTQFSLFAQFLSYYFPFPPHVVSLQQPIRGLWAVPVCLGYGRKRLIPLRLVAFKAVQGIDRAIREGRIFCMYMHLKDFGAGEDFFFEFEKILSYIYKRRGEGRLEAETMSELVRKHNGGSIK